MSKVNVNTIEPSTGTDITLGASGDTITVPSGATFTQSGTMNASAITAGTLAIAQGGTGAATFAAAGLDNNPSFSAERSSAQAISDSTRTTILFNNEFYDSDSDYDTTTGKFTPQTAGKYYVSSTVLLDSDANGNLSYAFIELYKNASPITEAVMDDRNSYGRRKTACLNVIIDMNGSSDYLLVQAYIVEELGGQTPQVGDMSTFQAFKVIGA